ncbi:hypothetical protein BC829DRAFT_396410 [Chytridium lagenaria]|nr:hypothetical protein BC829DRAFT_396410 [Chytridium lagenaria]
MTVDVKLTAGVPDGVVDVAIIGAGAGGIAMACNLKMKGIHNFVIFEKSGEVGGCWFDNTYPGCGCDVPSHMYSFSFNLNPNWSKRYSKQPEILQYMKDTANKFGIYPNIRFNSEILSSDWDEATSLWTLEIRTPQTLTTLRAKTLILAVGGLSIPNMDLTGRRVAVLGNGASAVQIVSAVGKIGVEKLIVFQRTANWTPRRGNVEYSRVWRWMMRNVPGLKRGFRWIIWYMLEFTWLIMRANSPLHRLVTWLFLQDLKLRVKDPVLRQKLTPNIAVGCKRITPSDEYYETLQNSNVDLVTDSITKIESTGIVDDKGELHKVDVLVLATGFDIGNPIRGHFRGRNGIDLVDLWKTQGIEAHRGTFIHHFPNFAILGGPNTGLGHNSQIQQMESQINLVLPFIVNRLTRFEVKGEVQKRYNETLQRRFKGMVWSGDGCVSWYREEGIRGRIVALWPGTATEFWWSTWGARWKEYDLVIAKGN